jgi:hypothetical protein
VPGGQTNIDGLLPHCHTISTIGWSTHVTCRANTTSTTITSCWSAYLLVSWQLRALKSSAWLLFYQYQ